MAITAEVPNRIDGNLDFTEKQKCPSQKYNNYFKILLIKIKCIEL